MGATWSCPKCDKDNMGSYCDCTTDEVRELEARIKELEKGSCRFNCRTAKQAFLAGFDAGAEDCFEGGRIICDEFYHEVTDAAYKEFCE